MTATIWSRRGEQMLSGQSGPARERDAVREGFMTVQRGRFFVGRGPPFSGGVALKCAFHKWNEIWKAPAAHPDMHNRTVFWHFAAVSPCRHRRKMEEAEAEHKFCVAAAEERRRPEAIFQMPINKQQGHAENRGKNVLARENSHSRKTIWTPR